ncbi:Nidogen-2 [Liparis tanakae]|uniref:Nidogen-2 n=1 Tax=Liparis tanakae TaxID=230148 RepID=A0A4Z2GTP5_9TELE|nr:Nidogen-2 [Liparis tanakae]
MLFSWVSSHNPVDVRPSFPIGINQVEHMLGWTAAMALDRSNSFHFLSPAGCTHGVFSSSEWYQGLSCVGPPRCLLQDVLDPPAADQSQRGLSGPRPAPSARSIGGREEESSSSSIRTSLAPLPASPPLGPDCAAMDSGGILAACLLCWSCVVCAVSAIRRADMFPYGALSGDQILAEGDDETSRVLVLPRPLNFYDTRYSQLYVATNGIISAQDLPMEKQYVDDGFPTDFPVVAPFLADIDTSGGRGQIYYRVTETPGVLNRVAQEVHRGFPDAKFTPTHAVVATWEDVAAYEERTRTAGPSNKVNTFQAVIGYDETDSYVLFLYPEGGLNFFGTRPKESYNVEIELPARVGFSRGEITYLIFSRTEGPHYSVTSDEQSVKNLYQVGNTGIPGVWLFHTGNSYSFDNIVPASIGGLLVTPPVQGHGLSLVAYGSEDVPLTSDPRYNSEPRDRQYAPPNPPERAAEGGGQQTRQQQPQLPLEVVDVYPPHRNEPPLSPGGHVVSVDEDDVDFDTGGGR